MIKRSEYSCLRCGGQHTVGDCPAAPPPPPPASGSAPGCAACEWNKLQVRHMHDALGLARAEFSRLGGDFARLRTALRAIQELTDDGEQHKGSGFRISRISTICAQALAAAERSGREVIVMGGTRRGMTEFGERRQNT